MALFKFVKCIVENRPIELFNDGKHSRDFTYIDDIVQGIVKSCDDIPSGGIDNYASLNGPATSPSPFRLFNVGNGTQVSLMSYVRAIESRLQKTATIKFLPLQPGDVSDTFADISLINETIGYKPETSVIDGVSNFVDWYLDYHEIET
jgi:UDP-glucuronate 4-epimerase